MSNAPVRSPSVVYELVPGSFFYTTQGRDLHEDCRRSACRPLLNGASSHLIETGEVLDEVGGGEQTHLVGSYRFSAILASVLRKHGDLRERGFRELNGCVVNNKRRKSVYSVAFEDAVVAGTLAAVRWGVSLATSARCNVIKHCSGLS